MKYFHTKLPNDSWKGVVSIRPMFGHIKGMCIPYGDFSSQKGFLDGKAGIYIYIWIDPSTGHIQKCYIGETENLAVRPLQKHGSMTLDWHFLAVFFREHDIERYFDTDSRQYMEQALIDMFPYPEILLNGNGGHKGKHKFLTEEKQAVSDVLIEEIVAMAPALCFGLFIDFRALATVPTTTPTVTATTTPTTTIEKKSAPDVYFYIKDDKRDIDATMFINDQGKYIVQKGSRVSLKNMLDGQKNQLGQYKKRVGLETDGTIVDRVFTVDYKFSSPSGAATIVRGAASNGYSFWRTEDGATLDEWLGR